LDVELLSELDLAAPAEITLFKLLVWQMPVDPFIVGARLHMQRLKEALGPPTKREVNFGKAAIRRSWPRSIGATRRELLRLPRPRQGRRHRPGRRHRQR